eukprot:166680_1
MWIDEACTIASCIDKAFCTAAVNVPCDLLLLIGEYASSVFAFDPENSSSNGWKFLNENRTVEATLYKYNYLVANRGFSKGKHAWRVSFRTTTMYILFGVSCQNRYQHSYTFRDKSVHLLYLREAGALEWPIESSEMNHLDFSGFVQRGRVNKLDLLLDCEAATLTYSLPDGRKHVCKLSAGQRTWFPHISIGAEGIVCSIELISRGDFGK